MRVSEVAKNGADIKRGKVMMCVEGKVGQISIISSMLDSEFDNCDYEEDGEKEGNICYFWSVDRSDVGYFRQQYKKAKNSIK